MVQCKPQPRGISQGKRGSSLQDKESFLVSCKRFLLFQKSPACAAAGGRHHACFAQLEDTGCCSFPPNISHLLPLGLNNSLDCRLKRVVLVRHSCRRQEMAQRLGRKGTTAAMVPAAPCMGVKMCSDLFLPLHLSC